MNNTNVFNILKVVGLDASVIFSYVKLAAFGSAILAIFLVAIVPGRRYNSPSFVSTLMYGPVLLLSVQHMSVYTRAIQSSVAFVLICSMLHEAITDNKTIAQFGLASLVSIIFECNRNDFLTAIILVFISIRTLFLRWDIPDGNQGEYTMCNKMFSFENTLIKQSLKRRIMRDCFALNIYKARGNIFTSPLKVLYEGGECTRYALDQAALLAERHSNQQLIQGSALQLGRLFATGGVCL